MNESFSVVPFSAEHIKRAAEIERLTFSEPWSESSMRILAEKDYPSLALVDKEGACRGYVTSSRALDELQIINVAVHPDLRGRGLGNMLLSAFDGLCRSLGIVYVSLEVRESNTAAIALYSKFGYTAAGKRKGFYRAPSEDALVMVKDFRLSGASEDI